MGHGQQGESERPPEGGEVRGGGHHGQARVLSANLPFNIEMCLSFHHRVDSEDLHVLCPNTV